MTNPRIGARKRHEIRRVNETARLRMTALLPAAADLPDTEPSVYTASPPGRDDEGPHGGPFEGPPEGVSGRPSDGGVAVGVPPGPAPETGEPGSSEPAVGAGPPGPAVPLVLPGHPLTLERRAAVGLLVLLLLAVGYGVQHFWLARPQPVEVPAVSVGPPAPTGTSGAGLPGEGPEVPGGDTGGGAPAVVVVDIGGKVATPGVHTLPNGSRVADALRVAGGPLPGTDTRNLNLARVLADGEQVLVGEPNPQPAAGAGPGPPPAGPSKQPVSLNRATLEQLDTLPGVGPTLAQRIIAFRASHGGAFRSLDQLRQVSGVGEHTYAELRPLLTL
ncbi:helix-hairpin-helix domain-containing protein [Kitasatospora purpeofusca]|uniref:helix-hairpin-helix domain-containing protein n=1 Tax=Kitasatospora purpeofusca TaxID=67352 RepID=UPI002A59F04D|nr:helix-hairpin-helix domain-containing protein [Kitasatospora purpeofusca]MDY0816654.1 helix-hairpin-helix domain-containing protein [Kitasatospora purpeofusca]